MAMSIENLARTVSKRNVTANSYGSMWADYEPVGSRGLFRTGYLPKRLAETILSRRESISQMVYSYGTPIAWFDSGVWIVPSVHYSPTTAKHQSNLRRYLPNWEPVPYDVSREEYERVINGKTVFRGSKTLPASRRNEYQKQ